MMNKKWKYGFEHTTGAGQKRLMYKSVGLDVDPDAVVDLKRKGDYGADPLGNGMFKMVPSGDVVDSKEKERRLNIK